LREFFSTVFSKLQSVPRFLYIDLSFGLVKEASCFSRVHTGEIVDRVLFIPIKSDH